MTEVLFILFIMFVAYIIYRPAGGQQTGAHSPEESQAEIERSAVSAVSQVISEKPVAVAKTSTSTSTSTTRAAPKKAKEETAKPVAAAKGKSTPELVGLTAGNIWNYLDENGPTTVAKLAREIKANDKTIQRSIGWLAQEDKITLKIIDRAETIALKE
ncbi:MAG: winged helix-turn-helix domain-containing protein [Gammaproteobacteria bacterium]